MERITWEQVVSLAVIASSGDTDSVTDTDAESQKEASGPPFGRGTSQMSEAVAGVANPGGGHLLFPQKGMSKS